MSSYAFIETHGRVWGCELRQLMSCSWIRPLCVTPNPINTNTQATICDKKWFVWCIISCIINKHIPNTSRELPNPEKDSQRELFYSSLETIYVIIRLNSRYYCPYCWPSIKSSRCTRNHVRLEVMGSISTPHHNKLLCRSLLVFDQKKCISSHFYLYLFPLF